MGWSGKKNGELLELMRSGGFDALFTFDRNLQYQQNFRKFSLPVIVLNAVDNSYITLSRLVPKIKSALTRLKAGITEISE